MLSKKQKIYILNPFSKLIKTKDYRSVLKTRIQQKLPRVFNEMILLMNSDFILTKENTTLLKRLLDTIKGKLKY